MKKKKRETKTRGQNKKEIKKKSSPKDGYKHDRLLSPNLFGHIAEDDMKPERVVWRSLVSYYSMSASHGKNESHCSRN